MSELPENVVELYFSKLKTAQNPGVILAQFYNSVMGVEVGRSEIILFSKLVKLWGRTAVFFAVVDISRIDTPKEFPYGLLHHICKTKLEKSTEADLALTSFFSLERKITDLQKEMSSIKKIDPDKASKYLEGNNE
jgi:hypothetical protein